MGSRAVSVKAPFWMVHSPADITMIPARYATLEDADKEAIRLAKSNPGVDFFVLKADHSYKAPIGDVQVSCHFDWPAEGVQRVSCNMHCDM